MNLLTYTLILGSIAIAIVIGGILGGWKFGNLLRTLEVNVPSDEFPHFWERLSRRLTELGFIPAKTAGVFTQGGGQFQAEQFTHAKTPKLLRAVISGSDGPQTIIQLTLHYQETIVTDTGEGAYRDAVLDYITGKAEEMGPVPNRSLLAVSSLVGAVLAWLTLIIGKSIMYHGTIESVIVVSGTYTLMGAYAVFSIWRNRNELTGSVCAIIGMVGSLSAAVAAVIMKGTFPA